MIIKSRAEWGARPPKYTNPLNYNIVDKFILHYSGAARTQTIRSIQNYSMDTKGYSDIDYNYIIKDGVVFIGRGDNIGGHTLGNNSTSIGVCIVGMDGDATEADFQAAKDLYAYMNTKSGKTLAATTHRMVLGLSHTDCPGDEIENWVKAGMPVRGENMTYSQDDRATDWATTNRADALMAGKPSAKFTVTFSDGTVEEREEPNNLQAQLNRIEGKLDTLLSSPSGSIVGKEFTATGTFTG